MQRNGNCYYSAYSLKLIKFELICTGHIFDDNFEQEYETTPFWLERNVTIIDDEDFSGHDYRSDILV